MRIDNYFKFISESKLELLLEGNINYCDRFKELISNIKSPIADSLLSLQWKDVDINTNYIDIDPSKDDVVTFIPDTKIKKYTIDGYGYNDTCDQAFKNPYFKDYVDKIVQLRTGDSVEIVKEITLDEAYKIYPNLKTDVWRIYKSDGPFVIVKSLQRGGSNIYNKNFIRPDISELTKSEIKIGRFVKRILDKSGNSVSDKEIEDFVNKYKSQIEIENNAFLRFKIVYGEDIRKYYHCVYYADQSGTLGNSCMRHDEAQRYLDIYVKNQEVVLMIVLMDRSGDDKITGRAILWTDSKGRKIMDRIYTIKTSDETIFKDYAIKEGYIYKKRQSYDDDQLMFNGEVLDTDDNEVVIKLNPSISYDYYPFLDSMKYLNTPDGCYPESISNFYTDDSRYILNRTDGGVREFNVGY